MSKATAKDLPEVELRRYDDGTSDLVINGVELHALAFAIDQGDGATWINVEFECTLTHGMPIRRMLEES